MNKLCILTFSPIETSYSLPPFKRTLTLSYPYRRTVDFARQMEAAGVSFLTVHGRTQEQRSEPVNTQAIADVCASVHIPVVANGGVHTLEEAWKLKEATGARGVFVVVCVCV